MKNLNPRDPLAAAVTAGILLFVILVGFAISKLKNSHTAIILSWLIVLSAVVLEEHITVDEVPVFRMLGMILVTLFAMKIPVVVEFYRGSKSRLSFVQWVCFSAGWFGMRPRIFESFPGPPLPGWKYLAGLGMSRLLLGAVLVWLAGFVAVHFTGILGKVMFTGLLLAGLSLILHFGILNISAGMWRFCGVDAKMLFRSPLLSISLKEFWGRRWNLAFSEMTSVAIYKPLRSRLGKKGALLLAFLFSGLLHEMALSVPVKAGYGLPMLYFAIHGFVMLLEDVMESKGMEISKNKLLGRAWVIFWLVVPLPLLFHKTFLHEIVWPLIGQ